MKDDDISPEKLVAGDKSGIDLSESRPSLEALLKEHEQHLAALPDTASALDRARVQLDIAETLLALQRKEESWKIAREVFDTCAAAESWQDAIEACDILFQCEQDESLAALGNGVWLSITFPVPAGAAVAAMAANYIAELRTEGEEQESLTFFTRQILAGVAKRHRGIEDDPEMIKMWIEILGLNDVQELLSRLAAMLDAIVGDNWWVDRDALREKLPVN
jgi:hypothetical protein